MRPAKWRTASIDTPPSLRGCPGPGLITRFTGRSDSSVSTVTLSLRNTTRFAPSSTRYCTTLNVKLS